MLKARRRALDGVLRLFQDPPLHRVAPGVDVLLGHVLVAEIHPVGHEILHLCIDFRPFPSGVSPPGGPELLAEAESLHRASAVSFQIEPRAPFTCLDHPLLLYFIGFPWIFLGPQELRTSEATVKKRLKHLKTHLKASNSTTSG